MMRIQNEQDVTEAFPDLSLTDISNLLTSAPDEFDLDAISRKKIDSFSLGDREYESLYDEHFYPNDQQGKKLICIIQYR